MQVERVFVSVGSDTPVSGPRQRFDPHPSPDHGNTGAFVFSGALTFELSLEVFRRTVRYQRRSRLETEAGSPGDARDPAPQSDVGVIGSQGLLRLGLEQLMGLGTRAGWAGTTLTATDQRLYAAIRAAGCRDSGPRHVMAAYDPANW